MDITVSEKKLTSNKFINGESVNYIIAYLFSFFVLIAVKQLLKIIFPISTDIACVIGFAAAEAVLLITERFFVYRDCVLSGTVRQILLGTVNAFIHLGLYRLGRVLTVNSSAVYDFTVWFIIAFLVFVINYPLSRILIFECIGLPDGKKNGRVYRFLFSNRFVVLAMTVSMIAMIFMFIVFKVFPFGDTTVLRMDLYHQYGPLFTELYDRVVNRESFFYSMTSGGGSSFLGNYFNYLSSPLNALIFLFNREQIPFAISFLVALKCVLSAGSFTLYLKISLKRHSCVSAAFGVFYSFSAYMLAYFWNIMWLDGMFILPVIALGIERIINRGKCGLYICSLIYMLYSSYYIGYMMCIFSVLYFISYFALSFTDNKIDKNLVTSKKYSLKALRNNKFINRGVSFAVSSVFAAAVCAFFLIPVCFVLSGCSATSNSFPDNVKSYFTVLDFIQSHFAALETTIRSSGDDVIPNVYCGVLTLILVPLFIVNKEIRIKEKAVYTALLIILFASFNTNYINFVWHALHFPNDLPYRFSFMYSFILLVVSFKALMHIKAIGIKEIGFTSMFWIAAAAVSQELPTNKISDATIYITIAFLILWTAFLFLAKKGRCGKLVISALVIAITFCEVIVSDTESFNFNQRLDIYNQNYATYTESSEYIRENDKSLYRTELCRLNTRMDPCLYNYRGISVFSSMAYEEYSGLQYSLGMYGNRINSYTYNTQTPVYNLMYAIKYLIYNGEPVRPDTRLYTKFYESAEGDSIVYENDYFLPIAYCVNSAVDVWSTAEGDPFTVQSDFFSLATGYSDVFAEVNYASCEYEGINGESVTGNGTYWFEKETDNNYGNIDITIEAVKDGNVYLYLTSPDITNISCEHGDVTVSQEIETPYILDLGYANTGDEISISIDGGSINSEKSSFEIYAYSLDAKVLNAGYKRLLENSLDVSEYSETKIKGTLISKENCILYSSIPYDEGWSVYVDGEKAEIFEIGKCQLGVMIKPGKHTVEYVYRPKGFLIGAAISAAAITALFGYELIKRKNTKSKINKETQYKSEPQIGNNDNFVKTLK